MRFKIKILLFSSLVLFLFSFSSCNKNLVQSGIKGKPRNIILIIGDGMGLSHVYGAMTVSDRDLYISQARNIGFNITHSYDNYNTDSAASGTAMSTGKKTRNGMLGLSPDSTMLTNMVELIHRNGLSLGVVSTSAVTHATPASFVAHSINRNNYDDIALDFIKNKPEVFIGGGRDNFSNRKDGKDLVKELLDSGYDVVYNVEDLINANSTRLAGLLAPMHMPKISEGRGDMLAYSAIKAIETLSKDPDGFFLMIEASQIDFAAHMHDTKYVLEETIDLDRTLGVVLDYADRLGETLVVVTADHETGGMTLVGGDARKSSLSASFSVGGHTGTAVPVFSFGPAAYEFTGFFDNTEIFEKIKKLLALK